MERINQEREQKKTGIEDKPTGKEIFQENMTEFDEITLDDEPEFEPEEAKIEEQEVEVEAE
jgi:hypothetical protein